MKQKKSQVELASETFSQRLNRLMKERKLSLRQASEHAQVPKSTIQDWKSGGQPTDYIAVHRLAVAMGTTMSFLLIGKNEDLKGAPSVAEVFTDGGIVLDGYCEITIRRLIPRKGKP